MAAQQYNEAYDFSLFEERKDKVVRMPDPHKKEKEKKRSAVEGYLRAFLVIVVTVVFFSAVGLMVYSKMELSEIGDQLVDTRNEMAVAQSEYVRLQAELEESMATRNMEQYVQQLGMKRIQPYQIEYYMINDGDKVELSENSGQKGLWESIVDFLTGWMS